MCLFVIEETDLGAASQENRNRYSQQAIYNFIYKSPPPECLFIILFGSKPKNPLVTGKIPPKRGQENGKRCLSLRHHVLTTVV